jgi:aminopeptidase N
LSEALADYTAAVALWQLRGSEGQGQYDFNEIVKDWVQSASELRPGASLYLAHRMAWNDERDGGDNLRLRYGKGPLVVHALRLELQRQKGSAAEGDRYFIALLRSFLKHNRYGWATTPALVKELENLTGGNWQPWFEKYVYGTEIPHLPK